MRIAFGDLEADGLLDTVTKVHCGVFREKGQEALKFGPGDVKKMLAYLDTVDVLIIHNGLGYDLPLLEKLYGYTFKGKVVDTLIMSRLLSLRECFRSTVLIRRLALIRLQPGAIEWEEVSQSITIGKCSPQKCFTVVPRT